MTADEMRISDWSADVCSSDLLPIAVIGNEMVYRKSQVQAAGFDTFPEDTDGFLKLCQALKAKGTPAGFALGHAVLDGNAFAHWLLCRTAARWSTKMAKSPSTRPKRMPRSNSPAHYTRRSSRETCPDPTHPTTKSFSTDRQA